MQKDADCLHLRPLWASGIRHYDFTCLAPQLPLSGPPCLSSRIGFGNFPGLGGRVWWVFSWTWPIQELNIMRSWNEADVVLTTPWSWMMLLGEINDQFEWSCTSYIDIHRVSSWFMTADLDHQSHVDHVVTKSSPRKPFSDRRFSVALWKRSIKWMASRHLCPFWKATMPKW